MSNGRSQDDFNTTGNSQDDFNTTGSSQEDEERDRSFGHNQDNE